MSALQVPRLSGTVGDAGGQNATQDVKLIQDLLNAAVRNGDLPGESAVTPSGKIDVQTIKLIELYERRNGVSGRLGRPKPGSPKGVLVEPGSPLLTVLAKNPLVDARWNEYDSIIKMEVASYNNKLRGVAGYSDLDWRWVKAMIWTEVLAGPDAPQWQTRPMQIGNAGDPGLKVVTNNLDHSGVVVPPELRDSLKHGTAVGNLNVRAGIALLIHIAATPYKLTPIVDNPTVSTHTLAAGETLSSLAPRLHTTVDEIVDQSGLDPQKIDKLRPGAVLKYRQVHMEWKIVQWKSWQDAIRAYNGGGDASYMEKVNRAYAKISANFPR